MITKAELEALAEMRLLDAEQLFQSRRFSAAYYLSGFSHKLDELLGLASLKEALQDDMESTPRLFAAWGVVSKWREASRYAMWDTSAAASIVGAVGDQNHGVLQWLKKHW